MYNAIICRYHEIATKGHNRNMFERCLVDNIRHQTKAVAPCKVQRVRGRVWLEPKEERDFTPGEVAGLCTQLKKVFGLETFSPVVKLPVDMDAIREAAVKMAPEALKPYLEEKERITFRIRARRSGDSIRLSGGTKSLKKLFIDRKIPAAERSRIPVLADDRGILGVYSIGANMDRAAKDIPAAAIQFIKK